MGTDQQVVQAVNRLYGLVLLLALLAVVGGVVFWGIQNGHQQDDYSDCLSRSLSDPFLSAYDC